MGDDTGQVASPELRMIRATIFSVVVPCQEPCNARKIRKEYFELDGEEIPFQDYNFKSLDDFLRVHPQLNSFKDTEGGWLYTAKLSPNSAHIQRMVAGQKKKSKRKSKSNAFHRSGSLHASANGLGGFNTRASYHGRPNVNAHAARKQGAAPFGAHRQSFGAGASNNRYRSQANNGSMQRPANPADSTSHGPFRRVGSARFTPSTKLVGPAEGIRRIMKALDRGKGAAILRIFCKHYANAHQAKFDGHELRMHFNTTDLGDIVRQHADGKIVVTPTEDGSVMLLSTEILEAQKRLAKQMEERAAQTTIIKPTLKQYKAPSIVKLVEDVSDMLIDQFPKPIPISELSDRCKELYNVDINPVKLYSRSWQELARCQFKERITLKGKNDENYAIHPLYGKAMGLDPMAPSSPRRAMRIWTLADLGIRFTPSPDPSIASDCREEGELTDSEDEAEAPATNTPMTRLRPLSDVDAMASEAWRTAVASSPVSDSPPNSALQSRNSPGLQASKLSPSSELIYEGLSTYFSKIKPTMKLKTPKGVFSPVSSPTAHRPSPAFNTAPQSSFTFPVVDAPPPSVPASPSPLASQTTSPAENKTSPNSQPRSRPRLDTSSLSRMQRLGIPVKPEIIASTTPTSRTRASSMSTVGAVTARTRTRSIGTDASASTISTIKSSSATSVVAADSTTDGAIPGLLAEPTTPSSVVEPLPVIHEESLFSRVFSAVRARRPSLASPGAFIFNSKGRHVEAAPTTTKLDSDSGGSRSQSSSLSVSESLSSGVVSPPSEPAHGRDPVAPSPAASSPVDIEFRGHRQVRASGGFTSVSAINRTGSRLAFRMTWKDEHYSVFGGTHDGKTLVVGFLEPDEHFFFQIAFEEGPVSSEEFIIQYIRAGVAPEPNMALSYQHLDVKTVTMTIKAV